MKAGNSRTYFVYILASRHHGSLYVGVTNSLLRRVREHRDGSVPGFTKRYGIKRLVYYEMFGDVREAIAREKEIKKWRRDWRLALIEKENPVWGDLWHRLANGASKRP
jgi:putative endonuclease